MSNNEKVKFTRKEIGLMIIALSISLICFVYVGYAQDSTGTYENVFLFERLGLEFRFDNGWSTQFNGKIHKINDTALMIEWFKYDNDVSIKNDTYVNNDASYYNVDLSFYVNGSLGRVVGIFNIYWYDEDNNYWGSYQDEGVLIIRDNTGVKRNASEIITARIVFWKVYNII